MVVFCRTCGNLSCGSPIDFSPIGATWARAIAGANAASRHAHSNAFSAREAAQWKRIVDAVLINPSDPGATPREFQHRVQCPAADLAPQSFATPVRCERNHWSAAQSRSLTYRRT